MKYLRWALGVLLGLYALMGLYPAGVTVGHKTGLLTNLPADAARMVPLMDAMAWWQVVVWIAALLILGFAAWRLLRGGKALLPFAIGFVVDIGGWLTVQSMDAYRQIFTARELQMDYYILGGLLVALLLTWWIERTPPAAAATA